MFNALKYSKELERAGFTREQAETTIGVFFKFMEHEFATKQDLAGLDVSIQEVRSELKSDIQKLRAEMKSDIHELRTEVKSEIQELRAEVKSDILELRAEMKSEIQKLWHAFQSMEYRMTIKMGAMQVASVAVLATAIKFL